MRFHRLSIAGFGPFAGEEVIDFDQLGSAGLFLLSGPTGAGKTTILDALCYALFGETTGEGQAKGSIDGRCIFSYIAKEMDYTLAEMGRHMGNRDHTTVRHTLTTFHNMIDTQEGFKSRFEEVYLAIKERKEKENGKIHQM